MKNDIKLAMVFLIIAFIGIVLIIIYNLLTGKGTKTKRLRHVKSKNQLMKDNKYITENEQKIKRIFDEKYEELNPQKKKILFSVILFIAIVISIFLINNKYYTYISLGLSVLIMGFNIYDYSKKSNGIFLNIVKEVLCDYDKDLEFKPREGFSNSEYALCHFPEQCDRFLSEDMIVNPKKGFHFADITVESEYRDDDGNTHYSIEYEGSLARMYIKDINCKIFLGGIGMRYNFINDFVKIDLENDEFNKLFMAYTDNELLAYKILTPDVMEEFVNIKKSVYGDIDIRIINNKLYIRFLSGNGFDDSSFSKDVDRENLCKSIAVLEEVIYTMDKIKKIIDEKNVE